MEAFDSDFNDGKGYQEDGSGGGQGISAGKVGLRFLVVAAIVFVKMVEEGVFFLWMRRWFLACQGCWKNPTFQT